MQNKSTNKKRSVLLGALLILLAPCICSCGDKPQQSRQQEIERIGKEGQALKQAFLQKYPPKSIEAILQLHTAKSPAFADQARQLCKDFSAHLQKTVPLVRELEKLATEPQEKKQLQQDIKVSEQIKNSCDNLAQRGTDDELVGMLGVVKDLLIQWSNFP